MTKLTHKARQAGAKVTAATAVRGRKPIATRRAGFTLVEVIVATVIAAFILGSLATSIGQLARARDTSKLRLDAHLRADRALSVIRSDVASIIRHSDLHWTRLHIQPRMVRVNPTEEYDRDELLIFNNRLRAIHDLDFSGEGTQYETHYRIEHDETGPTLWQRRDPVPDEFAFGGGVATPLVHGIIGLAFEAYDGYEWRRSWDSDEWGIPYAVRITVVASGARNGEDTYDAPQAVLRTVVAIDRVPPPPEMEVEEDLEEEELEDVSDPTVTAGGGARGGNNAAPAGGGAGGGRGGGGGGDGGARGGGGGRGMTPSRVRPSTRDQ